MGDATDRKAPSAKPRQRPRSDSEDALPHDLPIFPENAPRDEKGEPLVRP